MQPLEHFHKRNSYIYIIYSFILENNKFPRNKHTLHFKIVNQTSRSSIFVKFFKCYIYLDAQLIIVKYITASYEVPPFRTLFHILSGPPHF